MSRPASGDTDVLRCGKTASVNSIPACNSFTWHSWLCYSEDRKQALILRGAPYDHYIWIASSLQDSQ